jgi:hypothetical protein
MNFQVKTATEAILKDWRFGGGLALLTVKSLACYEMLHRASDLTGLRKTLWGVTGFIWLRIGTCGGLL